MRRDGGEVRSNGIAQVNKLGKIAGYLCLWALLGSGIFYFHQRVQTEFNQDRSAAQSALRKTAQGQWQDALVLFNRAIEYRPNYPLYPAYRSGVRVRLKDFDGAVRDADRALAQTDGSNATVSAIAYLNKGEALFGQGRNEEAVVAFSRGLALSPEFPESHYFRGWALRKLGKLEQSNADFEKAKKMQYQDGGLAYQKLAEDNEDAYRKNLIPSGTAMKGLTLGFDRLLADIYWLAFVQYYGDRDACIKDRFRQAPSYLSLVCELDPHFIQAYWFASFVIAGDLGLQKEAEDFLDKGIRLNQEDWTVPYIAGFNQYLYNKNEKKAAYYYDLASKRPKAPAWLASQAKIFKQNIPSRNKKIHTWKKMFEQSKDAMVKEKARSMMILLYSMNYRDATNDVMRTNILRELEALGAEPIPASKLPAGDD